jgi:formylglycine-generating enzyme required for sulfatase activity
MAMSGIRTALTCILIVSSTLSMSAIQVPQGQNAATIEFVKIAPGEFTMGCIESDPQCDDEEKPAHRVRITRAFELGKYEVTQAQWQAVMGTNPSQYPDPVRPVENVSWNDIQEFLAKMNARNDGYRYRLPTEAEWEYAARAGSTGLQGSVPIDDIAWYEKNSMYVSHPVGQKKPNAWGLYDMQGSVWEWTQDWYANYTAEDAVDPAGPATGQLISNGRRQVMVRIGKGGSWYNAASSLRISNRGIALPTERNPFQGFRCARQALPF